MQILKVQPVKKLAGTVSLPGDKSISHRALILGSLADGQNRIAGSLEAADTVATLDAIRSLGIQIECGNGVLRFHGGGMISPQTTIDCRNSGTTMRLLAGLLAGSNLSATLEGSSQLRKRPMGRIVEPLKRMGAEISSNEGHAPLSIKAAKLTGIDFQMPIPSAQVKSALLLAGWGAQGETHIGSEQPSRDHTELMLAAMGAPISWEVGSVLLGAERPLLQPLDLVIPGDFSSAAFLIVAALMPKESDLRLVNVGLNPTRTGLLDVLWRMGADIVIEDETTPDPYGEPFGTLRIRSSQLQATEISGGEIVRVIDELPVLAVAATQAKGETIIRDAGELRVKEVDRIGLLVRALRRLGAEIEELPAGMAIWGPTPLRGSSVSSHGDHRLAMALVVAGLFSLGETSVSGTACIQDSFPNFESLLVSLGAELI